MKRRSDALTALLCAGPVLAACGPSAPAPERPEALLSAGGRRTYASAAHTCAIDAGIVRCWGAADRGQTGDGSLAARLPVPTPVAGLPPARAVAAGGTHTCVSTDADLAERADGAVLCFGDNAHGQGGVARPFLLLEPVSVPGLPTPVRDLAAGLDHTCAIAGGSVWCWGRNESGEAGRPPPADDCRAPFRMRRCSVAPSRVEGSGGAWALALGGRHTCAIADAGLLCWGANEAGQLGDGTRASRGRPAPVSGLPGPASAVAAGAQHTCALVPGGVSCWGAGRTRPTPWLREEVRLLAAGGDRTCAAGPERVWCSEGDAAPRPVPDAPTAVRALAVSLDHACVLREPEAGGGVHCWGEDDFGQLGTGAAHDADGRGVRPAWTGGALRDVDGDGRVTLVCLGDSNTAAMPGAGAPWCDRLGALLPGSFRVVNRGLGGATASAEASLLGAERPVAYAIENDAPEVAVLAYGTNDLLGGTPAGEVADALAGLAARLREAGALPLVALVPPVRSDDEETNRAVSATNDALRAAFPPERIVDFAGGFGDAQLLDRVHFGDTGQVLRAQRAARAVARFLPADASAEGTP